MIDIKSRLGGLWIHLLFVLLLLLLFGGVLFSGDALRAPDAPIEGMPKLSDAFQNLVGKWRFDFLGEPEPPFAPTPGLLLLSGLGPRYCQIGIFIFDVVFLYAAAYYLLRGRRLAPSVCAIGALAMAFSGHSFTLISAGHMGKFNMMPWAVLTFAFLDRAFERKSLFHFAVAGISAGLGMAEQQDVMLMFGLLAAAYALFKWARTLAADRFGRVSVGKTVGGVLLAGLMFGAVAAPVFLSAGRIVEAREALADDSPERKWEKATDWSLPPEDMLEFVAPCVFGIETGDPKGPYWSRLGRPMRWKSLEEHGMPNYRQHTVYLGAMQVLFAIFGVIAAAMAFRRRKETGADAPADATAKIDRSEIVFWAIAWVFCVLLAIGRYGPIYWLFYKLPYVSAIRAPVKFMHLVELATVVLFASGLSAFIGGLRPAAVDARDKAAHKAKSAVAAWKSAQPLLPSVVGGFLALVLLAGTVVVVVKAQGLAAYWDSVGVGGFADKLRGLLLAALFRGGLILAAGVVLLEWGRRSAGRRAGRVIMVVVALVVAADVYSVGRKYIRRDKASLFESASVLMSAMKKDAPPCRAAFPFSEIGDPVRRFDVRPARDPLSERLIKYCGYYGVDVFDMSTISSIAPDLKLFLESVKDQARLWQLTNCRYLLGAEQIEGQTAMCGELVKYRDVFAVKNGFAVVADIFRQPRIALMDQRTATHLTLVNRMALAKAMLFYSWEELPEEDVRRRLGDKAWDPVTSVLVTGTNDVRRSERQCEVVEIGGYGRDRVDIKADAKDDAVLLLNDRHDRSWKVYVDGVEAEMLRCNFIMRGVRLAAGSHEVSFRYGYPYLVPVIIRYSGIAAVLLWALVLAGLRLAALGKGR